MASHCVPIELPTGHELFRLGDEAGGAGLWLLEEGVVLAMRGQVGNVCGWVCVGVGGWVGGGWGYGGRARGRSGRTAPNPTSTCSHALLVAPHARLSSVRNK